LDRKIKSLHDLILGDKYRHYFWVVSHPVVHVKAQLERGLVVRIEGPSFGSSLGSEIDQLASELDRICTHVELHHLVQQCVVVSIQKIRDE
jgi:hypothetical protein